MISVVQKLETAGGANLKLAGGLTTPEKAVVNYMAELAKGQAKAIKMLLKLANMKV